MCTNLEPPSPLRGRLGAVGPTRGHIGPEPSPPAALPAPPGACSHRLFLGNPRARGQHRAGSVPSAPLILFGQELGADCLPRTARVPWKGPGGPRHGAVAGGSHLQHGSSPALPATTLLPLSTRMLLVTPTPAHKDQPQGNVSHGDKHVAPSFSLAVARTEKQEIC